MNDVMVSISGLPHFVGYFSLSLLFLIIFKFLYTIVTPHNEWRLVKNEQNIAAAIGLGGAILGYALTLASAASNSVSIVDFAIWGAIGLISQLVAFAIVRFGAMPKIVARIENNEISAGIILGIVSVSVGILNAACMTY